MAETIIENVQVNEKNIPETVAPIPDPVYPSGKDLFSRNNVTNERSTLVSEALKIAFNSLIHQVENPADEVQLHYRWDVQTGKRLVVDRLKLYMKEHPKHQWHRADGGVLVANDFMFQGSELYNLASLVDLYAHEQLPTANSIYELSPLHNIDYTLKEPVGVVSIDELINIVKNLDTEAGKNAPVSDRIQFIAHVCRLLNQSLRAADISHAAAILQISKTSETDNDLYKTFLPIYKNAEAALEFASRLRGEFDINIEDIDIIQIMAKAKKDEYDRIAASYPKGTLPEYDEVKVHKLFTEPSKMGGVRLMELAEKIQKDTRFSVEPSSMEKVLLN